MANDTGNNFEVGFFELMAHPIRHGLIVTDVEMALSYLGLLLEEVENMTPEQLDEFYPMIRDLETAMRSRLNPPGTESTED